MTFLSFKLEVFPIQRIHWLATEEQDLVISIATQTHEAFYGLTKNASTKYRKFTLRVSLRKMRGLFQINSHFKSEGITYFLPLEQNKVTYQAKSSSIFLFLKLRSTDYLATQQMNMHPPVSRKSISRKKSINKIHEPSHQITKNHYTQGTTNSTNNFFSANLNLGKRKKKKDCHHSASTELFKQRSGSLTWQECLFFDGSYQRSQDLSTTATSG